MLKFRSRPWIVGLLICGLAMPVWAQGNGMRLDDAIRGYEAATHQTFRGLPDDWSHHHVVFSRPEPGSDVEHKLQRDGRYWLQQIKEKMPAAAATSDLGLGSDLRPPLDLWPPLKENPKAKLKNDWSANMGSGAMVGAGQYPAKFSFFPIGTPNCTTDYVVFNTGLASVAATGTLTQSATHEPAAGSTVTIGGIVYTFESSLTAANQVLIGSSEANSAANLEAAINASSAECGNPTGGPCFGTGTVPNTYVTASVSTDVITVTAITAGPAGDAITLAASTSPDSYVTVSAATLTGGANAQASILAFNNLYATTCSTGTVPAVYWAYNTGGTVVTAPVLSPDGSQIAFIQSSSSIARLVLLKWAASPSPATGVTGTFTSGSTSVTTNVDVPAADVGMQISGTGIPTGDTIAAVSGTTLTLAAATTSAETGVTLTITAEAVATPGIPPTVTNANYRTCTAPCMTTIAFSGSHNDTNSFPFYDYSGGDLLFAGDNSGYLHEFEGVFNGTPSEAGSPFPVLVSTATTAEPLTTPVYDSSTKEVYVGEGHGSGATDDGYLHWVCTASSCGTVGANTHSGPSGAALCHGSGFLDGPVLDPSATVSGATTSGTLYIGCGYDDGGGNCTALAHGCIRQFEEGFSNTYVGIGEPLGTDADVEIFAGAFDHEYLTSSAPTGHYYVIGDPGGDPIMYSVPITTNAIGTETAIATLSGTSGAAGSPVTEFYNSATSTDWLFMGTTGAGNQTSGCTASDTGCVYSFNVTTAPTGTTAPTASMASEDGSSGIIVDNASSETGASNIYFSTLGNQACTTGGTGGCAIQAAQSGL